jgi:hypothetical protein
MANFGGLSRLRFFGVSAAKVRLSRRIGIPLTRSGGQPAIIGGTHHLVECDSTTTLR